MKQKIKSGREQIYPLEVSYDRLELFSFYKQVLLLLTGHADPCLLPSLIGKISKALWSPWCSLISQNAIQRPLGFCICIRDTCSKRGLWQGRHYVPLEGSGSGRMWTLLCVAQPAFYKISNYMECGKHSSVWFQMVAVALDWSPNWCGVT